MCQVLRVLKIVSRQGQNSELYVCQIFNHPTATKHSVLLFSSSCVKFSNETQLIRPIQTFHSQNESLAV